MKQLCQRLDPARPRSVALGAVAVGVVAGIVAALFLTVAGEPTIEEAIRLEHTVAGHDHGDKLVSRGVQKGAGLFGAYALSGAGFGLLFAVAFLVLGRDRPALFRRALLAGALLAGAFTVVPWLKYPPNPPAVGDPGTVGDRQRLYVLLIVLTLVVFGGLVHLSRRLRLAGMAEATRVAAIAGLAAVVLLAVLGLLPPAPDAVELPATLVWRFRLASLGGNLLLWSVLAVGFGLVAAINRPAR